MKKKCRVYKPQSMQQGGEYRDIMAQDSIRNFQRQKMFEDMSIEAPVDSPALYLKDGKYIPVGTEFSQKRVSPKFIDPTITDLQPIYQKGGEPTMTQDSQKDNVPQEKANNFMTWLHESSNRAEIKNMMDEDQALFDNGFQAGGSVNLYAQDGASYPGLMPLIPEIDTETPGAIFGRNAEQDFADQQFNNFQSKQDYNRQNNKEFVPYDNSDKDKKTSDKGKFGSIGMDPRNANIAQGIISGMNVATAFGNLDDRYAAEQKARQIQSDVFRTHGVAPSDRGDYLANTPGIGSDFRPDQHTRMGYNTKIAQFGGEYNQDDELELTEQQINDLIAQGYNLEYLD